MDSAEAWNTVSLPKIVATHGTFLLLDLDTLIYPNCQPIIPTWTMASNGRTMRMRSSVVDYETRVQRFGILVGGKVPRHSFVMCFASILLLLHGGTERWEYT